jgi:cell division protein FtsB
MKAKKKRSSTKAQIRAEKERQRRIGTVIFTALILIVIVFSAYFGYSLLSQSQNQTLSQESSQPKAAIVDQLSLTFPNQTFIEAATNILKQAGYMVDYYPGEKVTVEFYKNLPTYGYKIIILRVHSSAAELQGKEFVEAPVGIFTAEQYSQTRYVYEQLTDQLVIASYTMPQPPYYFAIVPKFVTQSMKGTFKNTVIIMMGCEGLNNTKMAEAFIQKGAKTYIGWKGSVSASHTDTATISLLQHLITEKQTVKQAVENTMKEVGPDPTYKSQLTYYPLNAAECTIKKLKAHNPANAF